MKKVKLGVFGTQRGDDIINCCRCMDNVKVVALCCATADNAEVVAICDKWEEGLRSQKEHHKDLSITYYNNFEDFIKHDMDAVVLANYAHDHAPFAIKAMKAGKHVYSEVIPAATLKEAVELIEAVEETGMIYAYGENYCYMGGPYEMKKLYQEGRIGELEYAECEYIHNGEKIWPSITYGDPKHWRNWMYSTFYCTHSLGPILHATGLRPVVVTEFETTMNKRRKSGGSLGAQFGIEMVELENGALVKSIHGGLYKDSIWYSMYGDKGRMETVRRDHRDGEYSKLYVNFDEYPGEYPKPSRIISYRPEREYDEKAKHFGHGGSDCYSMYNFVEKLKGDEEADIIDVYEAMDMFLPGMFAYRSILAGGVSMEIPNLRNKEEREKWRKDTACTFPEKAGDMLLPTCKGGTPVISDEVYEKVRQKWEEEKNAEDGYTKKALRQGDGGH